MFFEVSPRAAELQKKLTAFMDEHVYPNEETYYRQLNQGDRWDVNPLIESLKKRPKLRICGTCFSRKANTGPD